MAVEAVWRQPVSGQERWNRVINRDFRTIPVVNRMGTRPVASFLCHRAILQKAEQGNNREFLSNRASLGCPMALRTIHSARQLVAMAAIATQAALRFSARVERRTFRDRLSYEMKPLHQVLLRCRVRCDAAEILHFVIDLQLVHLNCGGSIVWWISLYCSVRCRDAG